MVDINTRGSYSYEELKDIPAIDPRHIKPPRSAYFFIPNQQQIVEFNPKLPTKTLRRIFEGLNDLLPFEKEKLQELSEEIEKLQDPKNKSKKSVPLDLPKNWKPEESLRFLQASGFKIQDCIKLIRDSIEWKSTYFPFTLTPKAFELLNLGFVYVHGRDKEYRPIIVLKADYYVKYAKEYSFDDWLMCIIYFMEYVVNNLLIPGQVENWNIITDLGKLSLLFIPNDMKRLMRVLQSNYRCRLYVNFIFGMSTFLRYIWNIIKSMLDESSAKKIRFMNDENRHELFAFINEEQIEEKFGGKAKNITSDYFPPYFPSNNYLGEEKNKNIVSESTYREMCSKHELAVVSPYLVKELEEEEMQRKQIEQAEKEREEAERVRNIRLFEESKLTSTKNSGITIDFEQDMNLLEEDLSVSVECTYNQSKSNFYLNEVISKQLKSKVSISNSIKMLNKDIAFSPSITSGNN